MDEKMEKAARAERLAQARMQSGHKSPRAAARSFHWNENTYKAHENGVNGFKVTDAYRYAKAFGVDPQWLFFGTGDDGFVARPSAGEPDVGPGNATIVGPVSLTADRTIPVYGQAIGGAHGEFILNGNHLEDVLAPPALRGVKDAYAVYVVGSSMEPRYEAGETVYVNPGLPVGKGNYVVAQIADGDGAVHAYVKRFVSMDNRRLVLEQLNPAESLEFDRGLVRTVHRIIMSG